MPPRKGKEADPLDKLGLDLAADHAAAKTIPAVETPAVVDEVANALGTNAAQAIAETDTPPAEPAVEPVDATIVEEPPVFEPEEPVDVAFERQLDRLMVIVEDADFGSGTALGDLRDVMLDIFKTRDKPWHLLDANQRRDLGVHVEKACKLALRRVVQIIAEEESLSISGTLLAKWNVSGDALEAKVKVDNVDGDVLSDMLRLAGHRVMVISADEKRFSSERRPGPQGEGQPDLPFEASASAPPREIQSDPPVVPPAGDTDLAGEDGDEAEPVNEDDSFGVFDADASEWLVNEEGGDEGWSASTAGAGRWPFVRATELAATFPDDNLTVRQLDPATTDDAAE